MALTGGIFTQGTAWTCKFIVKVQLTDIYVACNRFLRSSFKGPSRRHESFFILRDAKAKTARICDDKNVL